MTHKETRKAKIYSGNDSHYKPVSQIKLQGKWLEKLGFVIGTPVDIKCENGKLTITAVTE
jgi:hypothetical protein